jgi:hypothetical protein
MKALCANPQGEDMPYQPHTAAAIGTVLARIGNT